MNSLPTLPISLPFIFRGKQLFSVPLRLTLKEVSLSEALAGRDSIESGSFAPAGSDGCLHCRVLDQGGRTHALYADSVAYVLARDPWHYLSLGGSYEAFLHSRYSAKTRESFAREEARFAAEFGALLDLREYRSSAELAEFAALRRQVDGEAEEAGPAGQLRPPRREGAPLAFVLFAAARPVAYLSLLAQGDTLKYLGAGEREEFRPWLAGAIVHRQVIRRLFEQASYRYLDFCPGESEIKRQFANGALRSAVVLQLRRTFLNRLLLSGYAFSRRLAAGREGQQSVPGALRELVYAG